MLRYKIAGETWEYNSRRDKLKKQFSQYECLNHNDDVINLGMEGFIDFMNHHSMSAEQGERIYTLQIFADELLKREKLLLHAAVVTVRSRCFVIVGRPGEGKSTLVGLLLEKGGQNCVSIIADDRAVIAQNDNHLEVWNTPWSKKGICCKECNYVVDGIIFIEKCQRYEIYEINDEKAMKLLESMYPHNVWEKIHVVAGKLLKMSKTYKLFNNLIDFDINDFEKVLNG